MKEGRSLLRGKWGGGWHCLGGVGLVADKHGCLCYAYEKLMLSQGQTLYAFSLRDSPKYADKRKKNKREQRREEDVCNKCAEPGTHVGVCLCEEVWVKEERQKPREYKRHPTVKTVGSWGDKKNNDFLLSEHCAFPQQAPIPCLIWNEYLIHNIL